MQKNILVIYSTMINNEKSYSTELTNRFIKHYKKYNSKDKIQYLDLTNVNMANKTLNKKVMNTFFNKEDSDNYINQLKKIDKLIFSTPMTNFNVTTLAKNYMDHILVPNKTFSYKYSKKGEAIGLLTNLQVQILTTQGAPEGWYKWGNVGKYLKNTWKFAGAKVNKPFLISGTKIKENAKLMPKELIDKYDSKIAKIAKKF